MTIRDSKAIAPLAAALALGGCAREARPPVQPFHAIQAPPSASPRAGGEQPWAVALPASIPPVPEQGSLYPPPGPFGVPAWAGEVALPYAASVHQAAITYYLPPPLLYAVIKAESGFRSDAVSRAGARGLMQLMPRTARALGVRDPLDADQNIRGGALFLRRLADRFDGDLELTLAAYNAGPGTVKRYRGVPPYKETQAYVRRVLGYYWATAPQLAQR